MKNPLISVIIPVYNVEPYLRQCLDSVINQTLRQLEIICINDASTDGSLAILREYERRDGRVAVIDRGSNEGLSTTRNVGMAAASGKYLMFVDSDDFVDLDLCRKTLECAEANAADVVIYDYQPFFSAAEVQCGSPRTSTLVEVKAQDRDGLVRLPSFAWTKMIRTDVARSLRVRFPDGLLYEDTPFHWAAATMAKQIAILPECLYFYRQRNGSICYQSDWRQVDRVFVCDVLREYLQAHQIYDRYRAAFHAHELNTFYVLHDTIAARYRPAVMALILGRMDEDRWAFALSSESLDWRVRDFFLAVRGSLAARLRRTAWLAARQVYRLARRHPLRGAGTAFLASGSIAWR